MIRTLAVLAFLAVMIPVDALIGFPVAFLTGRSFRDFFEKYVAGATEIPYDDFFRTVGLRLERSATQSADPGFTISRGPGAAPGQVASVTAGSAAEKAGLRDGDIISGIDGQPFAQFTQRAIAQRKPCETVKLTVTRNGRAQDITFALGSRQEHQYRLVDLDNLTDAQRARRQIWFGTQEPRQ